jgi:hypothetical protein
LIDVTNGTGYVTFQNAAAGSYNFTIIKDGHPSQTEAIDYNGQPLTLSIALTGSINGAGNTRSNNLTVTAVVIIVAVAIAIAASFLIINRKKSPNVKKLQALQKQMKPKFKT